MSIENKIHSILISAATMLMVWLLIALPLFDIPFVAFIILHIIIGFSELFTIFVKRKFGIINPRIAKFLEQENQTKKRTEDEL